MEMNEAAEPAARARRILSIIGLIFTVIGIGFLCGAWITYGKQRAFVKGAAHVEGRVVDLIYREPSESGESGTYAPQVVFTADDGEVYTFVSSVSSSPPTHRAGETVDVLYTPGSPEEAEINHFLSVWFVPLILGFLGACFTPAGLAVRRLGKRVGQRVAERAT